MMVKVSAYLLGDERVSCVWGIENTAWSHLVRISHILLCLLPLLPRFCANPRPEPCFCVYPSVETVGLRRSASATELSALHPGLASDHTHAFKWQEATTFSKAWAFKNFRQTQPHACGVAVGEYIRDRGRLFCSGWCFEIPELSSKENFTQFMWSRLSNPQAFSFLRRMAPLYKCLDVGAPPRQQVWIGAVMDAVGLTGLHSASGPGWHHPAPRLTEECSSLHLFSSCLCSSLLLHTAPRAGPGLGVFIVAHFSRQ